MGTISKIYDSAEEEFNKLNNSVIKNYKWYHKLFNSGLTNRDKELFIHGYKICCLKMIEEQNEWLSKLQKR